jgi:hypothetical protein
MEVTLMYRSTKKTATVVNFGLAIAVLALVGFWPGWRAELQAQTYSSPLCDFYEILHNFDVDMCFDWYKDGSKELDKCLQEAGERYGRWLDRDPGC